MVGQHDGNCQCGTGDQCIAQGTLIADDGINAGEHDSRCGNKEYGTDYRARDPGKNVCQFGAETVGQEDDTGNLRYASGANTSRGNNADILSVAGAGESTEECGNDAAKALGHDAAVNVLDAIDLIAGGTGSGVIANGFKHRCDVAGEATDDGSANKSDGRTGLTGNSSEGEQLGQSKPRSILYGLPVEHSEDGSADNAYDYDGNKDEALREQPLATAEFEDQGKHECNKSQNQALRILRRSTGRQYGPQQSRWNKRRCQQQREGGICEFCSLRVYRRATLPKRRPR